MEHLDLSENYWMVQAGHRDSSWWIRGTDEPDRLALQSAYENQTQGVREHPRIGEAFVDAPAILIGGVPVFLSTARWWVSIRRLSQSVVDSAIRL
jgi:hypothetical protein